jgi:hypothetical protein
MRLLPLIFIILAGSLVAGEPTTAYPLWKRDDGRGNPVSFFQNEAVLPVAHSHFFSSMQ